MPRARNIKPSFFTNDVLAEVPALGRILFAGLWTIADREGRLEDRPKRIKAEILPYDTCNVAALLDELQARDFILRYTVDGGQFIQILAFTKHQNPHVKESASLIPAPDKPGASPVLAPEIPERAGLIPDSPSLIPDSLIPAKVVAALPLGVRQDVWDSWRRSRGKKLTADAIRLQSKQLSDFATAGDDPNEVIEQSIRNTWAGLFPLKRDGPTGKHAERMKVNEAIWKVPNERHDDRAIDGVAERVD